MKITRARYWGQELRRGGREEKRGRRGVGVLFLGHHEDGGGVVCVVFGLVDDLTQRHARKVFKLGLVPARHHARVAHLSCVCVCV